MEEKGVSRSMGDELKLGEAREVRAVEGCGRSYSGELSGVSGGEWHCHCAVDCLNAAACRGESGCGMTLVIDARATEAAVRGIRHCKGKETLTLRTTMGAASVATHVTDRSRRW